MDPLGIEGGQNAFSYADSRPTLLLDPTGLAVLVCSRQAGGLFRPFPFNHSYFWDDRDSLPPGRRRFCGKGPSTTELGPPVGSGGMGDQCSRIPGSDGLEDKLIDCCELEKRIHSGWFPVTNDCHSPLKTCQELFLRNQSPTPAPGGRVGPRCVICPASPRRFPGAL